MAHTVLITIHTAAAAIALMAGAFIIRPWSGYLGPVSFGIYFWSLVAMVVFVISVLAVDWVTFGSTERGIFLALALLDVFMIWRAYRAARARPRAGSPEWAKRYVGHVGFTLISLFAGFVIVLAIDLDAPVWAVVLVAVVAIAGGRQVVVVVEKRAERRTAGGR